MKAPIKSVPDRESGVVLMEDGNGSQNGGDRFGAEPERGEVEIRVCGNGDWLGSVAVVIAGCLSETDPAEGAPDTVFWRNDIKNMNEVKLSGILLGNAEYFCLR